MRRPRRALGSRVQGHGHQGQVAEVIGAEMSQSTNIEWCDSINPAATGRTLGAYKSAAKKVGCTVEDWINKRLSGLRHCFACRQWQKQEHFTVDRSRRSGLAARCKPCMSDASTASRYGLTVAQLRLFRAKHGNQCGICSAITFLYVDHDHVTGKLRGLLCPSCNTAIGLFKESPALFAAAVKYLQGSSHG